MSRIGKKPVAVPAKVNVAVAGQTVNIEGPLGKLAWNFRPEVAVAFDGDAKQVRVSREVDDRQGRALHGLTRAMIQNMIVGVTEGYEKKLEIVGVGYLAAIAGSLASSTATTLSFARLAREHPQDTRLLASGIKRAMMIV